MVPPTRQRLIEAANHRFYRDGFRGVGIDQILDDVGISKTAFYKHFESKEDLVLEVLRHHDRWWRDAFRRMVRQRGGDTALGQLKALMDVVAEVIESDEYRGCFFVNVSMEFPLPHDPAHVAAAESKRSIEEFVRDLATQAGAADPAALAEDLCLVMEGAYVTQQVACGNRTARIARRIGERLIAAYVPGAGAAENSIGRA
ncbi:MAG: TetR/AcrR family transcriptional regulator [Phycisphaerae bacterium]|nr:TetR/AcrR family transcriptional regulator [Phycisphaerae bacterium]NUQ46071.1 TetR/AcrR family transcriptional regulator [Phycisphaerae bacterium]